MEASQPHPMMMKKYYCDMLPPYQPLPPASQRSSLQVLVGEEGVKAQEKVTVYALGSLEIVDNIGPRDPKQATIGHTRRSEIDVVYSPFSLYVPESNVLLCRQETCEQKSELQRIPQPVAREVLTIHLGW